MKRSVFEDGAVSLPALAGLLVGREHWGERLDVSTDGFLRSFWAPFASVVFVLAGDAFYNAAERAERVVTAAQTGGGTHLDNAIQVAQAEVSMGHLWAGLAQVALPTLSFPIVALALVRWLGGGAGYGALVVTMNWALFWLNLALAVMAATLRLGAPLQVFQIVGLVLYGMTLYLAWRAARATLTGEVSLSLMMTLLYFACSMISAYAAGYVGAALG